MQGQKTLVNDRQMQCLKDSFSFIMDYFNPKDEMEYMAFYDICNICDIDLENINVSELDYNSLCSLIHLGHNQLKSEYMERYNRGDFFSDLHFYEV